MSVLLDRPEPTVMEGLAARSLPCPGLDCDLHSNVGGNFLHWAGASAYLRSVGADILLRRLTSKNVVWACFYPQTLIAN